MAALDSYRSIVSLTLIVGVLTTGEANGQDVTDPAADNLPHPTRAAVKGWGPLPGDREWGSTAGAGPTQYLR